MMDRLNLASILRKRGAVILDIRTPSEYAKGHICGAINIPTPLPPLNDQQKKTLEHRLKSVIYHHNIHPDQPVIVYCKKGIRAAVAACQLLSKLGIHAVLNLGGIQDAHLKGIMSGRIKDPMIKPCKG
jgi:rhodanese-related sulfurtransferase